MAAAASAVGAALLEASPELGSAANAFKTVFGLGDQSLSFERCPEGSCSALGWTQSSILIWFNPFVYDKDAYPSDWWERTVHVVVHEIGHVFNARISNVVGETFHAYTALRNTQANDPTFPDRVQNDPNLKGFAGPRYNWQQSPSGEPGEEFADMFIGWTFNRWETGDGGLTAAGQARADWMATNMTLWVDLASGR